MIIGFRGHPPAAYAKRLAPKAVTPVEADGIRYTATAELNRATFALISRHPAAFRTITADDGTEFHGYRLLEAATSVPFYFATPHHFWERGTNENTNGLLRQYLPKGTSLTKNGNRRAGGANGNPSDLEEPAQRESGA